MLAYLAGGTMAKKKVKQTEKERYEIEILDWSVEYSFGVAEPNILLSNGYMDHSTIEISGNIIQPTLKHSQETRIMLYEKIDYDMKREELEEGTPIDIGLIEIERKTNIVHMTCWISSRKITQILLGFSAQKINHISIFGTKIKNRKGNIYSVELSTIYY